MHTWFKFVFVLGCIGLTSCSHTLTPMDGASSAKANTNSVTGYLLFAVQSEAYIEKVNILGAISLSYSPNNDKQENAYILAEVPIGYYKFTGVKTGMYEIKANSEHTWSFNIESNTINYVGNLELLSKAKWCDNCFRLELANKSSFAIEYLESTHSELLAKTPLVYKGPGKDDFIEFSQTINL